MVLDAASVPAQRAAGALAQTVEDLTRPVEYLAKALVER
jgi:hypothetical protein